MATKTTKTPKTPPEERARQTLSARLHGALAAARGRAAIADSKAEGCRAEVGSLERQLRSVGGAPGAGEQLPLAAGGGTEDAAALRAELARVKRELAQLRAAVQKTPAPALQDGLVNIVLYKQETEGEVEWVAFVRETCMPVTAPTRSEALACVAETLEGYDDAQVRSSESQEEDLEEEKEARPLGAVLPPSAFGTATSWHALGKEWGKRDPRWKPELAADPTWVAATRLEDHELQLEELRPPELDDLLRGIREGAPRPVDAPADRADAPPSQPGQPGDQVATSRVKFAYRHVLGNDRKPLCEALAGRSWHPAEAGQEPCLICRRCAKEEGIKVRPALKVSPTLPDKEPPQKPLEVQWLSEVEPAPKS